MSERLITKNTFKVGTLYQQNPSSAKSGMIQDIAFRMWFEDTLTTVSITDFQVEIVSASNIIGRDISIYLNMFPDKKHGLVFEQPVYKLIHYARVLKKDFTDTLEGFVFAHTINTAPNSVWLNNDPRDIDDKLVDSENLTVYYFEKRSDLCRFKKAMPRVPRGKRFVNYLVSVWQQ